MKMNATVHINASPERVWAGLNDPAVLQASIPGCESVTRSGENQFDATAAVKVGPLSAKFSGKVTLSDLVPPHGYKISGEGTGGAAGFAKGAATVSLKPNGGGTDLTYDVDASVGGKIAQIGQRFIDQTAKKMADDFFQRFAAEVGGPVIQSTAHAPRVATAQAPLARMKEFRPGKVEAPNRLWLLVAISAAAVSAYFWFVATFG